MRRIRGARIVFSLFIVLSMAAGLLPAAGAEEEAPQQLGDVVVSATRTEKKVDEAPASVSVITRDDIQLKNIRTIDDALKYVEGTYVRRRKGNLDNLPAVSVRGVEGDERTLVMINGLPANGGYSSQVTWNQLPVDAVERIEVIRGPGSALYGGNAMGGVINIILREPEKRTASVRAGYGWGDYTNEGGVDTNCAEYRLGLFAADKFAGKFGLKASFDGTWSDGYPTALVTKSTSAGAGTVTGGYPIKSSTDKDYWVVGDKGNNAADRYAFNIGGTYDLSDAGKIGLEVTGGSHRYEYERPNSYLAGGAFTGRADAYTGTRTSTIAERNFLAGKGQEDLTTTDLSYDDRFGSVDFAGKLRYGIKDKWYTSPNSSGAVAGGYDDRPGALTDSDTTTWNADLQGTTSFASKHLSTFGVYYRMDDFNQEEYTLSYFLDEGSKGTKTGMTQGKSTSYAAFFEHEWQLIDTLTLYGGLRFDLWNSSDGKSGSAANPSVLKDSEDSYVSPKINAVWHPLEDTYVRGGVSSGFRPPNIYELYRTWTSATSGKTYYSNPDLNPETLWSYELGADQYFWQRRVKVGATVFRSDFENYIASRTVTGTTDTIKDNVGSVEINGLEMSVSVDPVDWMTFYGNATFNDAKYKSWPQQPQAEGKKVAGMPEEIINLGALFYHRWATLSIDGNYTGRIYTDELNKQIEGTYTTYSQRWLWDAKLMVPVYKSIEVELAVSNLFDEQYYDYYVGQPRTYFAGVTWKY